MQEDLPAPTTGAHHIIMTDPISALDPPPPVCVSPETSLAGAISELRRHNIGALLITDAEGKLTGIFTERDVLYKVAGQAQDMSAIPVSQVMTPNPTALRADVPIAHALHLMALHGFRHIPIVDEDGRPQGITSFRGMVQFIGTNIVPAAAQ
jgi:CBS domain-containing protein